MGTSNKKYLNSKENRKSNIELLRIIAMMLIVICHFATHGGFEFDSMRITVPRLWWGVIEMGGNLGVDIFVLISGYFLITDNSLEFNLRKVLKFWGQVFFYSVGLFFVSFLIGRGSLAPITVLKTLFPITSSSWWFASTYFVLYILHPYINKLLYNLNKRQFQGLVILFLIMWSVLPTFTTANYQLNPLLEFIMYYSIAGYIRLYGLNPQFSSKTYFRCLGIFMLLTYASYVVFILLGTKYPLFSEKALYFYGRSSLPMLGMAICLFMAFATLRMGYHKWINKIASAAFGVYLLHDSNLLREYLWQDLFKNAMFQDSNTIIIYSIGAALLIYSVCTIVDLIRQSTFEKIYMKMVTKYADRIIHFCGIIINKISRIVFGM